MKGKSDTAPCRIVQADTVPSPVPSLDSSIWLTLTLSRTLNYHLKHRQATPHKPRNRTQLPY
jgi:hypothetical protein